MADFETYYRQFLVDLNGDGRIDANEQGIAATRAQQAAGPLSNKDRQRISRGAMAGREPSAIDQGRLDADAPRLEQNTERWAAPLGSLTNFSQTAKALSQAYEDPSLPNATNAGVNLLMTALRPGAALGVLGAGYGAAAAQDAGVFDISAQAGRDDRDKRDAARAQAEAAKAAAAAEVAKAKAETDRINAKTEADRIAAEERKREADAALERQKQAERNAEYARGVTKAEQRRDDIRATDRSFKDSNVGQMYETTGGYAPMLMGAAGGLIHRMASGPSKGIVDKYVMPAVEGSALTFAGLNAPFVYDALSTPVKNPQREALEVYSRELPPGHPLKEEAAAQAQGMPVNNPVQERAWKELTDPMGLVRRGVTAVLEGAPAGLLGRNLPEASRAAASGVAELPGVIAEGYQKSMARADAAKRLRDEATARAKAGPQTRGGSNSKSQPTTEFSRYTSVPDAEREKIIDSLLAARSIAGGDVPAKGTARGIQTAYRDNSIGLPVTPARVDATQDVINQFIARTGRPPTRQELMPLLDPRSARYGGLGTLGVAGVAGGNLLMPGYDQAGY